LIALQVKLDILAKFLREIYTQHVGKLDSYPACPIQSKDWKLDLLYNGDYQVSPARDSDKTLLPLQVNL